MSNYLTDQELERIAEQLKALAHPHRLRLFLRLASSLPTGASCSTGDKCCVGDLGSDLDVTAPTVSHHLKELRRAGLVHVERRGRHIECWVERETLDRMRSFFDLPVCCPPPGSEVGTSREGDRS